MVVCEVVDDRGCIGTERGCECDTDTGCVDLAWIIVMTETETMYFGRRQGLPKLGQWHGLEAHQFGTQLVDTQSQHTSLHQGCPGGFRIYREHGKAQGFFPVGRRDSLSLQDKIFLPRREAPAKISCLAKTVAALL
jgi:hypothetical protein